MYHMILVYLRLLLGSAQRMHRIAMEGTEHITLDIEENATELNMSPDFPVISCGSLIITHYRKALSLGLWWYEKVMSLLTVSGLGCNSVASPLPCLAFGSKKC